MLRYEELPDFNREETILQFNTDESLPFKFSKFRYCEDNAMVISFRGYNRDIFHFLVEKENGGYRLKYDITTYRKRETFSQTYNSLEIVMEVFSNAHLRLGSGITLGMYQFEADMENIYKSLHEKKEASPPTNKKQRLESQSDSTSPSSHNTLTNTSQQEPTSTTQATTLNKLNLYVTSFEYIEEQLMTSEKGSYLFRSGPYRGEFILSFRGSEKVEHYLIHSEENTRFFCFDGDHFYDTSDLQSMLNLFECKTLIRGSIMRKKNITPIERNDLSNDMFINLPYSQAKQNLIGENDGTYFLRKTQNLNEFILMVKTANTITETLIRLSKINGELSYSSNEFTFTDLTSLIQIYHGSTIKKHVPTNPQPMQQSNLFKPKPTPSTSSQNTIDLTGSETRNDPNPTYPLLAINTIPQMSREEVEAKMQNLDVFFRKIKLKNGAERFIISMRIKNTNYHTPISKDKSQYTLVFKKNGNLETFSHKDPLKLHEFFIKLIFYKQANTTITLHEYRKETEVRERLEMPTMHQSISTFQTGSSTGELGGLTPLPDTLVSALQSSSSMTEPTSEEEKNYNNWYSGLFT